MFTISANFSESPESMGVVADFSPAVVNVETCAGCDAPIVHNVCKFVFGDRVSVVKLEAVKAAARFLVSPGDKLGATFFTFTVGQQSVRPKSGGRNTYFCYVMKSTEILPAEPCLDFPDLLMASVAPVAYVVVSSSGNVQFFNAFLHAMLSDRREQMREYWTSGILTRSRWFANSRSWVEKIQTMPGPDIVPASLGVSEWFTVPLVALLNDSALVEIIAAIVLEMKVMVVSKSQANRAAAVMGLSALFGDVLSWPHPCLASPPLGIATELPNAPTPVIAAIPPHRSYFCGKKAKIFESCLFVDLDMGGHVYSFWVVESARVAAVISDWNGLVSTGGEERNRVERIRKKMQLVVNDLDQVLSSVAATALSFKQQASIVASEFPTSALHKAVFESQAFQIRYSHSELP